MNSTRLVVLIAVLILALGFTPALAASNPTECVTAYDANLDYFPAKVTAQVAEGFSVEYFNHYKVVTVQTPWPEAEAPLTYLLVQCGTPVPDDVAADAVIEVPVQRVISMSTSFLPHLDAQGVLDRIAAIDTVLYTSNPAVQTAVEEGSILQIGGGGSGQAVNVEQVIDLQPDLILTQRFFAGDADYPALQEAGLPTVLNADFLDTSPLGVAEWGKFLSLFFNTEALAETQFAEVKGRYDALQQQTESLTGRPTVFAGTPYDGTWYMPGGRSYLAQLLADAGADYLWADDPSTGSLFLDFETVFDRAAEANFWVNVNPYWASLADAEAEEPRYAGFAAFQNDQVYSNNARLNANGGSDYFETGYANPDLILADLVRIFHPDVLPDHELYFYKRISQ
ncbi:MAG: ABC transporter substrate-binding protein [Anaerolineae bacterium]|nr:ABC transporter substrate-binding protein [Anaerolineae bacterium]